MKKCLQLAFTIKMDMKKRWWDKGHNIGRNIIRHTGSKEDNGK